MQLKLCCGFFILNVRCKFAYQLQLQWRKIHCFFIFNSSTFASSFAYFTQNWLNAFATCACAFRTDCGRDFFAAIATTTISAILPFSLRLRECFLYFQRKLAIKTGNAILVACFKHCSHNKKTCNTVRKNYACSERHSVFKKS